MMKDKTGGECDTQGVEDNAIQRLRGKTCRKPPARPSLHKKITFQGILWKWDRLA